MSERLSPASPPSPESGNRPAPGAKRARHQRWRRIAKAATVLAVLTFVVAGALFVTSLSRDRKAEATRDLLGQLGEALQDHRAREGQLPERLALLSLRSSDDEISREDGWGRPIAYVQVPEAGGPGLRLRSAGSDGQAGTPDDLLWPEGAIWPERSGDEP